jgi:hypothetical protein
LLSALNSGYVRRGNDQLPRQGTHGPWKVRNNYLSDAKMLRYDPIDDGILHFTTTPMKPPTETPTEVPAPQATA